MKWLMVRPMRKFVVYLFGLAYFISAYSQSHHPQQFLDSISGSKTEGVEIVKHYCSVCHAENPVIQIGAPRIGNIQDWRPRLEKGMDELFKNTSNGLNAMPARGGCFECTDEQLLLAISILINAKNNP